jgi:prepilin-type processing-associated H-X9-DG protein
VTYPTFRLTEFTFGTISHASSRLLLVDNGNGESLELSAEYSPKVTDLAGGVAPADPQAWLKGQGRTRQAHVDFYFAESRHRGKAACIFVDGHAELVYPAKAIVAAYAPDRMTEFFP